MRPVQKMLERTVSEASGQRSDGDVRESMTMCPCDVRMCDVHCDASVVTMCALQMHVWIHELCIRVCVTYDATLHLARATDTDILFTDHSRGSSAASSRSQCIVIPWIRCLKVA